MRGRTYNHGRILSSNLVSSVLLATKEILLSIKLIVFSFPSKGNKLSRSRLRRRVTASRGRGCQNEEEEEEEVEGMRRKK